MTAALLDVVSTHNCLSLFSVAGTCGCAPLRRAARALALRAFSAAMQQDVAGLLTLAEPDLLALLCSDRLQVGGSTGAEGGAHAWGRSQHRRSPPDPHTPLSRFPLVCLPPSCQVDSEFEVFQALAAWTEYDAPARKPQLAARMARCLRLDALTIPDVTLIDDHPLVRCAGAGWCGWPAAWRRRVAYCQRCFAAYSGCMRALPPAGLRPTCPLPRCPPCAPLRRSRLTARPCS